VVASNKKHLLVEGQDDKFAIIEFMAKHVAWGDNRRDWPVIVEQCNGAEELLAPEFIPVKLMSREVEILGIVLDADDKIKSRWRTVRTRCLHSFPSLPKALAPGGIITTNDEGKRLGIWIMPDNSAKGMLETFMAFLVPNKEEQIYSHAVAATAEAVKKGACCRECHRDKATIYTWLAWQDPPGQTLGGALKQNMLNAEAPYAAPFVEWFKALFELQAKNS
jgi:hypothetical protein